jgi:hypothetical protein
MHASAVHASLDHACMNAIEWMMIIFICNWHAGSGVTAW